MRCGSWVTRIRVKDKIVVRISAAIGANEVSP